MVDTFTCDNCGREWPREQLKEVKKGDSDDTWRLCPECLDKKMDEASEVYGVEGDEKRRAAYLAESPDDKPEDATGRRE